DLLLSLRASQQLIDELVGQLVSHLVRQPLKDPRRGRRRLAWRLAAGAVPLRINRSIDGLLGGCRHERLFRADLHTSWDTPRETRFRSQAGVEAARVWEIRGRPSAG